VVLLNNKVIGIQLSHGELEEPLLVSLESEDQVHTEAVKQPLETCVEKEECLLHYKFGEGGIEESILSKKDKLFVLH